MTDAFDPHGEHDPAGALPAGTLIAGKYEIVERIGAGGMGFIYRATESGGDALSSAFDSYQSDHDVAIKVMRERLQHDEAAVKRFRREARTVSQLSHPSIITLHDFGATQQGFLFIAMEWLTGEDLLQHIDRTGVLSPVRAIKIALQIAQGLGEAHKKGIIHRDLKPENIFLVDTANGQDKVKVLDFGIAKVLQGPAETQITLMGMICGTPDFMSPEQVRGEELDARADIYAVGCLLYRILTNKFPFPSDTPMGTALKQLVDPFPELPASIPAALQSLIIKATQKEPAERFQDASALCDALQDALAQIGSAGTRGGSLRATPVPESERNPIESREVISGNPAAPKFELAASAIPGTSVQAGELDDAMDFEEFATAETVVTATSSEKKRVGNLAKPSLKSPMATGAAVSLKPQMMPDSIVMERLEPPKPRPNAPTPAPNPVPFTTPSAKRGVSPMLMGGALLILFAVVLWLLLV